MSARTVPNSFPRFRKWMSWSSRVFIRYFIWLWFAGCAAVLAVSTFHLDKRYGITIGLVLAFTIWPALIGWLAISGFSILWHLVLVAILALHDRERPDFRGVLLFITFLAAGIVFLGGAIGLLCAFVWRALVKA